MKDKLYKFMSGRNGANELSRFLTILSIIVLIPSLFISSWVGRFLNAFALFSLVYANFIIFSKNITRRSMENQDFLKIKNRIVGRKNAIKQRFQQRKEYKFFKCSNCKTTLRVPKGKGKIKVHCTKCGNDMIKKS